jgi:DnaK suppressor protein
VITSAGKKTSAKAAPKGPTPTHKKLPVKKATPAKAARAAPKASATKSHSAKKAVATNKPVAKSVPKGATPAAAAQAPTAKAQAKAVTAEKSAAAQKPSPAPSPTEVATQPSAPMQKTAPGAAFAVPPGVVPRKPGRGTPKYFVAPVQAPLPAPTSRFADRFAPPRPPTREMNKLENDTPRERHKSDPKLANAWKTKSGRELTDAEILAMPDSEYMNEKQIDFFRVKLEALKNDLLSNAGETTEHLREDTSIVPDPADRATIEEEHALELRTRDRERKLLKKISQSLARLESGDYGFCDETGEPIGLGRLIARPTATLSLEAQQRRELKQKMFGD